MRLATPLIASVLLLVSKKSSCLGRLDPLSSAFPHEEGDGKHRKVGREPEQRVVLEHTHSEPRTRLGLRLDVHHHDLGLSLARFDPGDEVGEARSPVGKFFEELLVDERNRIEVEARRERSAYREEELEELPQESPEDEHLVVSHNK